MLRTTPNAIIKDQDPPKRATESASRSPRVSPSSITSFGLRAARMRTSCRSEEHTSELQSLRHLVCPLLLEKHIHQYFVSTAMSASRPAGMLRGVRPCL